MAVLAVDPGAEELVAVSVRTAVVVDLLELGALLPAHLVDPDRFPDDLAVVAAVQALELDGPVRALEEDFQRDVGAGLELVVVVGEFEGDLGVETGRVLDVGFEDCRIVVGDVTQRYSSLSAWWRTACLRTLRLLVTTSSAEASSACVH